MLIPEPCLELQASKIRLFFLFTSLFVPCVYSLYPDILYVSAEQILDLLKKTLIVNDVIDSAPRHTCMVSYFDRHAVELGNTLEAKELRYPPHWVRWTGDNNSYYTFLMIDPDEPSRANPIYREYIHWIVGNIKGSAMLQEKEIIYEYIGPDPAEGTGKHRIVYLVYRQPNGKQHFEEARLDDARKDSRRSVFSNRKFAEKYRFEGPVAVNFLYAEWGPNKSRYIPPRSQGQGPVDKRNEFDHLDPYQPW